MAASVADRAHIELKFWAQEARDAQPHALKHLLSLATRNASGRAGTLVQTTAMCNARMSSHLQALVGVVHVVTPDTPALEFVPDPDALAASVGVYRVESYESRSSANVVAALGSALDKMREAMPFLDSSIAAYTDSAAPEGGHIITPSKAGAIVTAVLGERDCSIALYTSADPHTLEERHYIIVRCYNTAASRAAGAALRADPAMTMEQLHFSQAYKTAKVVSARHRDALAAAFARAVGAQLSAATRDEGTGVPLATPADVLWYNVVCRYHMAASSRSLYAYYAEAGALREAPLAAIPFGVSRTLGYELLANLAQPANLGTHEASYGFPLGSPKRPASVRTAVASTTTMTLDGEQKSPAASVGIVASVSGRVASAVRWANEDIGTHPKMVVGVYDEEFIKCPHNLALLAKMAGYPAASPHLRLVPRAQYISSPPEPTLDDIMRFRDAAQATVRLPVTELLERITPVYTRMRAREVAAGREFRLWGNIILEEKHRHFVVDAKNVQRLLDFERESRQASSTSTV